MQVTSFCAIDYVAGTTHRTISITLLVDGKWVLILSVLQYVIAEVLKKE